MKIIKAQAQLGSFVLDVENVSFKANTIHALIGENGSGKSTLLKLVAGLLEGNLLLDESYVSSREVTMLFQKPHMLNRSVRDNLRYPLHLRKQKKELEIDAWLQKFSLWNQQKENALSLSSGEKQKLAFARALLLEPKLVLLDECFSNVDSLTTTQMEEVMIKMQVSQPKTWIFISHHFAQVERLADMVHFMYRGSIYFSGTVTAFLESDDPILQAYIQNQGGKRYGIT